MDLKEKRFNQIVKDIRSVKIQGAREVARAALEAYHLIPNKRSKKTLISLRPTEPMMEKVLELAEKKPYKEILKHFDFAQEKINSFIYKLIKNDSIVFTHCHSTNVVNALIYSYKKKKRFEVYSPETRPLYQGRKTAKQLRKVGIKVTNFVDSSIAIALSGKQGFKKPNIVFIGSDAILKEGVINKVGSGLVARIAIEEKIPFYVVADSWKFTPKKISIEQRSLNEVWDKAPSNIKVRNPAFEFVSKKYIKAIVSEKGVLAYSSFLKKV